MPPQWRSKYSPLCFMEMPVALDMPAGIAHAPGGIPLQGLVLEFGLGEPEDEVVLVPLVGVLLHALPDAYRQVLLIVVVEDIIALQLGGVEINVAAGQVGVALVQQARMMIWI